MRIPDLVLTNMIGGAPIAWKCPACSEPFHLDPYTGTPEDRLAQMREAYAKHFSENHSREDASQAAARIVREATES